MLRELVAPLADVQVLLFLVLMGLQVYPRRIYRTFGAGFRRCPDRHRHSGQIDMRRRLV
jgi:hypothetical protein